MPLLYWLGPACMLHDGSHFALSSNPIINRVCAALGSFHMGVWAWYHQVCSCGVFFPLLFFFFLTKKHKHVVGHHSYTNVLDRDPDLRAFEGAPPDSVYGHRLSPWAPYFPMYRRWLRSLFITIPFSCLQPRFCSFFVVVAQLFPERVLQQHSTGHKRVAEQALRLDSVGDCAAVGAAHRGSFGDARDHVERLVRAALAALFSGQSRVFRLLSFSLLWRLVLHFLAD